MQCFDIRRLQIVTMVEIAILSRKRAIKRGLAEFKIQKVCFWCQKLFQFHGFNFTLGNVGQVVNSVDNLNVNQICFNLITHFGFFLEQWKKLRDLYLQLTFCVISPDTFFAFWRPFPEERVFSPGEEPIHPLIWIFCSVFLIFIVYETQARTCFGF